MVSQRFLKEIEMTEVQSYKEDVWKFILDIDSWISNPERRGMIV